MRHTHPSNPASDPIDSVIEAHFNASAGHLNPSSGFVSSVMESIHAQADGPPPIAFPWRRALPGAVLVLCGLLAFAVSVVRQWRAASAAGQPAGAALQPYLALTRSLVSALTTGEAILCWIVASVSLSALAIAVSFRLTGGRQ